MRFGLLWAAVLSAKTAARLTCLSSSLISIRNDEISGYSISSIFSGLSTRAYLMAVTTVTLVNAAVLVVRILKAGTSLIGSMRAILPRHSATTLRTPSSSLSQ
uniref:Secreted protein n=1 Tax=Opuntia streptacantha TaxID=393608 RepID=A0A7C8YZC8_OPUST